MVDRGRRFEDAGPDHEADDQRDRFMQAERRPRQGRRVDAGRRGR
jgi:hypothetical protein